MKRKVISISAFVVCAAVFLIFAVVRNIPATENPISHLYTFGDSSVDIGRAKELTTAIVNSDSVPEGAYIKAEDGYYWEGRYSNGKVFTELLAEYLDVGITNYAVGGAKSGPDSDGYTNWSSWLEGTGGVEQTKEFVETNNGNVDSDALYLISTGGNDTYNLLTDSVENVVAESVSNIAEMVEDLADAGAKRFIVILQCYKPGSGLSEFSDLHKTSTEKAMAELAKSRELDILCVDFSSLNEDIENNIEEYGYKTLSYYMISDYIPAIGYSYHFLDNTKLFSEAPEGYGEYEYDDFTGYGEDGFWTVDEYYYYDEYHVTRTTHKHFFEYMKPLVEEFFAEQIEEK